MSRDPRHRIPNRDQAFRHKRRMRLIVAPALMLLAVCGCVDINLGGGGGGATAAARTDRRPRLPGMFVATGTMVNGDSLRTCPVFELENGIQYHLFKSELVTSSEFSAITEIGAESALEVRLRRDLDLRCQADDLREVLEVISVLDTESPPDGPIGDGE